MRARPRERPCPHGREQPPGAHTKRSARAPPAHVTREAPYPIPSESEAFARLEKRHGFDLWKFRNEDAPEDAAVLGQVEAVPSGEEHDVRIVLVDRDREAGREAAARFTPRP